MKNAEDLRALLDRIDRRGYPAYKDTKGAYAFGKYMLGIDHVQETPLLLPPRSAFMYRAKQRVFRKRFTRKDIGASPCRIICSGSSADG